MLDRLEYGVNGAPGGGEKRGRGAATSAASSPPANASSSCPMTGSFEEFEACSSSINAPISGCRNQKIPGDGVGPAGATVNGRTVFVFSKDFTGFRAARSGGKAHARKIMKVQGYGAAHAAPNHRPVR